MNHLVDHVSLKLFFCTLLGGFFVNVSKGDFAVIITAIAGGSTIIYNAIKIYKEFKNKP